MKGKIAVVSGTRAEFGLLCPLMKLIRKDQDLSLQVIATGAHLSPEFGLTYKEIEKEGFTIDRKVEMLLASDTPTAVAKSTGLGIIGFSEAFSELKPDLVIVLGDRYEILAAVTAAMFLKIPVAHLHGGETTEGAFDEAIRHSITKMSHLHFTSTEEYRRRVIQLGEQPQNVYNAGAIGLDNIQNLKLLQKSELEKVLGIRFLKRNLLITFHPVTLENNTAETQFRELLSALDDQKDTYLIFTKANADTDGHLINKMIDDYVSKNKDKSIAFTSMGQLNYLSSMQYADAVVGNSSSGIIEAPSFKIGTINIGDRQKGRIQAGSVINAVPNKKSIQEAFDLLYSNPFQDILKTVISPYGDGQTSPRILSIIKKIQLEGILKKHFFDAVFKIP